MEAKRTDLGSHATKITTVLKEACGAPDTGPLVRQHEEADSLVVSISCPTPLSRPVTTDLGMSERALRLAIPDAHQPRYWIGLHERWQQKGKHKIRFLDCGLRLYVGG